MKKSLLLISILLAAHLMVTGQEQTGNGLRKPKTSVKSKKANAPAHTKSSKRRTSKQKVQKEKTIVHTSPDQHKIDSIKNEKMKHKK